MMARPRTLSELLDSLSAQEHWVLEHLGSVNVVVTDPTGDQFDGLLDHNGIWVDGPDPYYLPNLNACRFSRHYFYP
jgi:hypothetical protein